MKISNFKPKELKRVIKKLESRASALKKQEPLFSKIKRWLFGG